MTTITSRNLAALIAVALGSISLAEVGRTQEAPSGIRAEPLSPGTQPTTTTTTADGKQKEDLLAYADLLFSKKQYPLAARQYQLFLKQYPQSPNAQSGWFRLGECYLQVGQNEDAATTFRYVIDTWKEGIFVGSAAYRVAVLRFNGKDFKGAVPFFEKAAANLSSKEASLQAEFYLARCLQIIDDPEKAMAAFQKVLDAGPPDEATASTWKNPFREKSLLELARLQYDVGNAKEAFAGFEELAKTAETPEYRLEALTRAGLLSSELGELEVSNDYLVKALEVEVEGDNQWTNLATVGLIFNYYTEDEYEKVLGLYAARTFNAPEDTRPKMLLIIGNSYRLTGNVTAARDTYALVEENYRELPEGSEAGYRKLQCLNQEGDAGFPIQVQRYVDRQNTIDVQSEFIDLALLMRAEWFFALAQAAIGENSEERTTENYAKAALDYSEVRGSKIPERFLPQRLYKLGWSQSESGDPSGAIVTFGDFIRNFSDHDLIASALAKRAETYQALQDYSAAIDDYREIADKHPDAREAEFSLQQIALIHGHRREVPEMIAAYRELLERFPETSAAPEAHYWIGVGLFDGEKYEEAVPELDQARKANPEIYGAKASLRIILSHYQAEKLDPLADEAGAYLEASKKEERSAIPPKVLSYLGQRLFDRQDFKRAELFLTASSTPDDPTATSPEVWRRLGLSRMQLARYEMAIAPFEHYLSMTEKPSLRAEAQLELGRAYFETKDYEEAHNFARDCLTSQKEGRTNAEARLLLGDVALAEGDPAAAAGEYLVVGQIFTDPQITPTALSKAAAAFRQSGDEAKAAKLESQVKSDYPEFQAAP